MKQVWKKSMCLAAAVVLLAGCGGNQAEIGSSVPSPEPAPAAETGQETSVKQEEEIPEGEKLAQQYTGFVETPMDLGGREIRFVTTAANRYTYGEEKDKTSNETLEIIEALELIEKDYNCKITVELLKGRDMVEAALTAKAAGETIGDILEFGVSDTQMEQIYANNLVMPLETPGIAEIIKRDSNPWLAQTGFGNMFGHQYGVHFKTNNSGDLLRGVVLFNKNLADKYNVGNLYDMVKNNEWTFDKFAEINASIASQAGGEVYPMAYSHEGIYSPLLVFANNGTYAENTDTGYVYKALSDNTLEATNFAADLVKRGYVHPTSGKTTDIEKAFADGEALFFFGNYNSLKNYTIGKVPTEDSFGLLPAPRGPQGAGYNSVAYTDALYHIMNNIEKPEEAAAVLVAIANRTSKRNMIDTELMYTLQDEESAEMLQLMYDNVVLDTSRTVSTARSTIKGANTAILALEQTPKEAYESIEATIQSQYDEVKLQE